jgi:hypothetical protein
VSATGAARATRPRAPKWWHADTVPALVWLQVRAAGPDGATRQQLHRWVGLARHDSVDHVLPELLRCKAVLRVAQGRYAYDPEKCEMPCILGLETEWLVRAIMDCPAGVQERVLAADLGLACIQVREHLVMSQRQQVLVREYGRSASDDFLWKAQPGAQDYLARLERLSIDQALLSRADADGSHKTGAASLAKQVLIRLTPQGELQLRWGGVLMTFNAEQVQALRATLAASPEDDRATVWAGNA